MDGLNNWELDNEVTGSIELRKNISSDSVSFTRFSNPTKIELITQESRSKKIIEHVFVDFVYNMRQSNGIDSIGWTGAGFLNEELQYTGFTSYNPKEGKICAYRDSFAGRKVGNVPDLKKGIREYYSKNFQKFEQAVEKLPSNIRGIVEKVLL